MFIKFDKSKNAFLLNTRNTTYSFCIKDGKYLVHTYYGKKVAETPNIPYIPYQNFSAYPVDGTYEFSLDIAMAEFPQFGSGDYRGDALRVKNGNGDCVTLYTYKDYKIFDGRLPLEGLPFATATENSQTLEVTLFDDLTSCTLKLYYTVFPEEDVISRYFTLTNEGESDVYIERGMSLALDLPPAEYELISAHGAHGRERFLQRQILTRTGTVMESRRGSTSHQMTNSFILSEVGATETEGSAFGFSFVYSGSFMNSVTPDQNGTTRVLMGIHPDCFSWKLEKGETFTSPEGIMTNAENGIGQVSRNLHHFANRHIIRPLGRSSHPVVLNTWEGNFFDIDEEKMIEYAKDAVKCGFDMLVMDDGWFGKRVSDLAGLGDWQANPERFKNGLSAFVKRIKNEGIDFGIWIEPEMVNPDSDLYRAHPEWVLCAKGRIHSLTRHQAVLDFTNPDVLDYLKKSFSETFSDVPLDYIKWDFNRNLTEVASKVLPADRQGEAFHRYMLGVYDLYQWFCDTYPNVMIENCSGGGGRYDLGMMKYSSQIWTSDNTEPNDRINIQYGSSMFYPASVMSCHVSNHGSSVEDPTLLDYGFRVAMQGVLGYEFDITKVSDTAKETIKNQIREYRKYEKLITEGDLYRLLSPFRCGKSAFYYMNEAKDEILVFFYQPKGEEPQEYRLKIDVPEDSRWIATLNRDSTYRGSDLKTGLVVRSSSEDGFATMFHFVKLNKGGAVKAEEESDLIPDSSITDDGMADIKTALKGETRYDTLLEKGRIFRVDSVDAPGKAAYCVVNDEGTELLAVYVQKKADEEANPEEVRIKLPVDADSRWTATLNRYSPYRGSDLRVGLIVRGSKEDYYTELFHFIKQ